MDAQKERKKERKKRGRRRESGKEKSRGRRKEGDIVRKRKEKVLNFVIYPGRLPKGVAKRGSFHKKFTLSAVQ